jgi:glycosyltransferase involved in cell wall biosynthesis
VSIIVPVWNQWALTWKCLMAIAAHTADVPHEVIVVDNGSTDDTAAVLERELADPALAFARVVRVPKNRGYGHGIHTGLRAARGTVVAFSHADQQCAPADVFAAFRKLKAAADPTRTLVKGKRGRRRLGAAVITHGMSIIASVVLGMRLTDINAQPKVFHRSHLDRLPQPPDGFPFDLYVLHQAKRAGLRIETIPVEFGKRGHGQSKWAFSLFSRWRTIWSMIQYIFRLRFRKDAPSANPAPAARHAAAEAV